MWPLEQFAEDYVESRVIVRQGNIRKTIQGPIVERHVDLLVLGTKGNTSKPGEHLGSVAEKLLRAMSSQSGRGSGLQFLKSGKHIMEMVEHSRRVDHLCQMMTVKVRLQVPCHADEA